MFFSHSSLRYVAGLGRPSIVALYSDHFIGEVRIKPILNALLARGIIGGYQIVDRHMELVGPLKEHEFSHIWCQRNVSTTQFRFLKQHAHVPIIYDLDDLLTSPPDFVLNTRARTTNRIEWCLQNATAVTVTSVNLAQSVREDVPALSQDIIVLKNGCASATPPVVTAPKPCIVWASQDRPYVLKDDPSFIERLARLTNRARYHTILIGRFDNDHLKLFNESHHVPYLDFGSYREFLRSCAGGIGLAPLPAKLPARSQRFFDAKSDIKLVDFLVSGMLPVCTSSVPYATSDLFVPELAGGDPDSLLERLEACMADPARMLAHVDRCIHANGVLRDREFLTVSTAMDRFFA